MRPRRSLSRKSRRPALQRPLAHEVLEPRLPLDGNVTVMLSGTDLRIEGDAMGNEIRIAVNAAGNLTLTGENNTTINGAATPFTVAIGSDMIDGALSMDMQAGDDVVTLTGFQVRDRFRARAGMGNDRFEMTDFRCHKLEFYAGEGDDVIDVNRVTSGKWTAFDLAGGNDVLALANLTVGQNFSITAGAGEDTVATASLTVGKKIYFDHGAGDDQTLFAGTTSVRKRADVGLGDGDDFFGVLPDRTGETARFRRRLKVWMGPGDDAVATDSQVSARRLRMEGSGDFDAFAGGGASARRVKLKSVEATNIDDLEARVDAVFARLGDVGVNAAAFGDDGISPLAVNLNTTDVTYTEGDGPVAIDNGLSLDGSITSLTGATVTIAMGFSSDEDQLSFSAQPGITGTYDADTGVLTFAGNASLATYQTLLRTVLYENTSEDPTATARSFEITVNRGGETASGARTFEVVAVNDPPRITLSQNAISIGIDDLPQLIDDGLTLEDVDNANLSSVTLAFTLGYQQGEDTLTISGQPSSISASFDEATGTLTLSGDTSVEDYQAALQQVAYANLASQATDGMRSIQIRASDGTDEGIATLMLTLGVNIAAPVIELAGEPLTYVENDAPVAVDTQLVVTDSDSEMLISATIQITEGLSSDEDRLSAVDQAGISSSYNATTGTLTLSGVATLAEYEAVLRSVTYENLSDDPTTVDRVVSFTANDGMNAGTATRRLQIVAVNDPIDLLVPAGVPATGTLVFELGSDAIQLDFIAEDPDDSQFVFQLDLDNAGISADEVQPKIDATTGQFSWQPSEEGVFSVRVIVVNESGQADQQLIIVEVVSPLG